MTLWWCLLGQEWNVSFLTLHAGPLTHKISHGASCILVTASALCCTLPPGWLPLHYPIHIWQFIHYPSLLFSPNWLCSQPSHVRLPLENSNLRPALPDRLNFPSHQAIHPSTTTSLTISLEILDHNLDNPSRCQQHCLSFCFVFIFAFPAPNHPSQHSLTPHHLDSVFSWTLLVV